MVNNNKTRARALAQSIFIGLVKEINKQGLKCFLLSLTERNIDKDDVSGRFFANSESRVVEKCLPYLPYLLQQDL